MKIAIPLFSALIASDVSFPLTFKPMEDLCSLADVLPAAVEGLDDILSLLSEKLQPFWPSFRDLTLRFCTETPYDSIVAEDVLNFGSICTILNTFFYDEEVLRHAIHEHGLFTVALNLWLRCLYRTDLSVTYQVQSTALASKACGMVAKAAPQAPFRQHLTWEFGKRERDLADLAFRCIRRVSRQERVEKVKSLYSETFVDSLSIMEFLVDLRRGADDDNGENDSETETETDHDDAPRRKDRTNISSAFLFDPSVKMLRTLVRVLVLYTSAGRRRTISSKERLIIISSFSSLSRLIECRDALLKQHIDMLRNGLLSAVVDCAEPLAALQSSDTTLESAARILATLSHLLKFRDVVVAAAQSLAELEKERTDMIVRLQSMPHVGPAWIRFRNMVFERSAFRAIYDHRFPNGLLLNCENVSRRTSL